MSIHIQACLGLAFLFSFCLGFLFFSFGSYTKAAGLCPGIHVAENWIMDYRIV